MEPRAATKHRWGIPISTGWGNSFSARWGIPVSENWGFSVSPIWGKPLSRGWGNSLAIYTWAGEVRNISVLVAIGVSSAGYREVIGVAEGAKEDKEGWSSFLRHLKTRGLSRVQLFITDKCMGLVESLGEHFPQARWQRCCVHFYRNVFSVVPKGKVREVAAMLKAIHAQEDREEAILKAQSVMKKLEGMKLANLLFSQTFTKRLRLDNQTDLTGPETYNQAIFWAIPEDIPVVS